VLPANSLASSRPAPKSQATRRGKKQIVTGKSDVTIHGLEPVGNYAIPPSVRRRHDTGCSAGTILHELGREQRAKWVAYLKSQRTAEYRFDLSARGVSIWVFNMCVGRFTRWLSIILVRGRRLHSSSPLGNGQ